MSKRAKDIIDKADEIFSDGKPRPRARVTELIDAELRKEKERAVHRWEREWWGIHGITLEELYKDASDDQKEDIDRYRAAILAEEED